MITSDNILEKFNFNEIGFLGLRIAGYTTAKEDTVSRAGITTLKVGQVTKVWIEEDPVQRLVAVVGGDGVSQIWTPYIYHIMDVTAIEKPGTVFYPGSTGSYYIGARGSSLAADTDYIGYFSYFNVNYPNGAICYHPIGRVIQDEDTPPLRAAKYINEWWHGLTNRNIQPRPESVMAQKFFGIMKERGIIANTGINAGIKPYLDIWGEFSKEEILDMQSQETLIIDKLRDAVIVPKNNEVKKVTKAKTTVA